MPSTPASAAPRTRRADLPPAQLPWESFGSGRGCWLPLDWCGCPIKGFLRLLREVIELAEPRFILAQISFSRTK
ncbi:hypothetical protein E2C01_068759 [Portunus trituberculatus]|uniref:Uncharacterized protein n=1 Tax=Portunus trituberculatus TaxID=210409 RepID=A0A5B7HPM9_PORTR|nr:hypothetical protein [Portunus trituberculatus]